jgi:hypothetical protein
MDRRGKVDARSDEAKQTAVDAPYRGLITSNRSERQLVFKPRQSGGLLSSLGMDAN